MSLSHRAYCGRFAPSPTGPLHFGSLVCALASFLDARAHDGTWLIRIEDIDPPRDIPGADEAIIRTLTRLGMVSDIPVVWQSRRYELYEQALGKLSHQGLVYGCACSRKEIATAQARLGLPSHVYPGTCRNGTHGKPARSLRVRTFDEVVSFDDRRCGHFSENLEHDVGDFVVKRADGLWAYQLAVVVDDAQQGVTDIVRGEDLLNNTPRQIYLQRKLGLSIPQYLHIALALDAHGQKLSKQTHAPAIDNEDPQKRRRRFTLRRKKAGQKDISTEAYSFQGTGCGKIRFKSARISTLSSSPGVPKVASGNFSLACAS